MRRGRAQILFTLAVYAAISVAGVFTGLIHTPKAYANGEQYIVYYPQDQRDAVAKAFSNGSKSDPAIATTFVAAKGGVWQNKAAADIISFVYNPDKSKSLSTYDFAYTATYYYVKDYGVVPGDTFGGLSQKLKDAGYYKIVLDGVLKGMGPAPPGGTDGFYQNSHVFDILGIGLYSTPSISVTDQNGKTVSYKDSGVRPGIPSNVYSGNPFTSSIGFYDNSIANLWNGIGNVAQAVAPDPGTGGGTGGSTNIDTQCLISSGDLGWIICPVIQVIDDGINFIMNNIVVPLLQVTPLQQDSTNGVFLLWQVIRNIADVGFVLIFMFIIFANTLSINVNAYTAKKMLPRLVAAVILVQFSFLLASLAVDIGNVFGAGIAALSQDIVNQLKNIPHVPGGISNGAGGVLFDVAGLLEGIVALLVGVIAFTIIGAAGVFLFVGTALIGALGVAFTLVARQLAIQFLVVISPIALAAWVLPGTENLFKKWYENLIKLVMMYPIIILLLSLANILGYAAKSGTDHTLQSLLAALFPIVAFLAIPATFKMSGGVMNFASGALMGGAGMAKKSVRGSQFAKDLKEQRRERGLTRNAENVPFLGSERLGRFIGRTQAGSPFLTNTARRRLAKGYDKVVKDHGEALEARFTEEGTSNATLAQLAAGALVPGFERNGITRIAAIRKLAERRAYRDLRAIRDGMSTQADDRVWRTATAPVFGQLNGDAPDLNTAVLDAAGAPQHRFQGRGYENISNGNVSPENLAKLNPETLQDYFDHYLPSLASDADRQTAVRGLMRSVRGLYADDDNRGKINPSTLGRLVDYSRAGAATGWFDPADATFLNTSTNVPAGGNTGTFI